MILLNNIIEKKEKLILKNPISLAKLLVIALTFILIGCAGWPENYFYVCRENAKMPVMIKGNIESGVFIIFNHGGPGGCGTLESVIESSPANGKLGNTSPFKILEQNYAIVYWDQRHSGQSKGTADPDSSRVEDFGEDLATVIMEIKKQYDVKKLILVGQSWGHTVATVYMTYIDSWEENQANVDGYINYKGNHEQVMPYREARKKILSYATEGISNKDSIEYWEEVKAFYMKHPTMKNLDDLGMHYHYVYEIMGGGIRLYGRIKFSIKASFKIPFNGLRYYSNNKKTRNAKKFMTLVATDSSLRETIHRIHIPTLLIYGRKDLISPVEVGQFIFDEIETPPDEKKLLVLNNSRHGVENEDLEIFQAEIKKFINKIVLENSD